MNKRKAGKQQRINMGEIKSFAKYLLKLNENQFSLEGIKSQRVQKIISKAIQKQIVKEGASEKIAFLINI